MDALIEIGKQIGAGVVLYVLFDRRLTRLETLMKLVVDDKIKKEP